VLRNLPKGSYQTRPGQPPPHHVHSYGHLPQAQHAGAASTGRAVLYGSGGLMGGAVSLSARSPVGMSRGGTGYGYLGMDPSDPLTWPRPFNVAPGMISYLNWQVGGQPVAAQPVSPGGRGGGWWRLG
jgi:hypothetical protein